MSGLVLAGLLRLGDPVSILLLEGLRVLDGRLGELVGILCSLLIDLAVLYTVLGGKFLAVQLQLFCVLGLVRLLALLVQLQALLGECLLGLVVLGVLIQLLLLQAHQWVFL